MLFWRWSTIPFIVTLICVMIWAVTANPPQWGYVAFISILGFFVGVLYFLIQFVGRLFCRQWLGALLSVVRTVACIGALVGTFLYWVLPSWSWDDTDHFADKLTIPSNIEISKPLPSKSNPGRGKDDVFQQAVMASLQKPAGKTASIIPSVPSLRNLVTNQRALLLRYLESSPAWRVDEERGKLFATRRWEFGTRWTPTLNGYYTEFDPYPEGIRSDSMGGFQTRTRLDFNGPDFARREDQAWMEEGTTPTPVVLKTANQTDSTMSFIRLGGDVVLEIYDQSPGPGRRMTEAALAQFEAESKRMLDSKEFDPSLLPPGSIQHGKPTLNLYEGTQPGIYNVEAWVNPGEAGTVYLKAYEVTHDQELSADRLYESSSERIGWSSDPGELFLSASDISIYEGDWGHPYAARFELWFKPDSGGPEKKLLARNFIIEGWQR